MIFKNFTGFPFPCGNEPPQDVPQWSVDYFELKAILASGSRDLPLCLNYLEALHSGALPLRDYQKKNSFNLSIEQGKLFTKYLLFLPYNDLLMPAPQPPGILLIPSSGCLMYLKPLFFFLASHICGLLVCTRLNVIFFCFSMWNLFLTL